MICLFNKIGDSLVEEHILNDISFNAKVILTDNYGSYKIDIKNELTGIDSTFYYKGYKSKFKVFKTQAVKSDGIHMKIIYKKTYTPTRYLFQF